MDLHQLFHLFTLESFCKIGFGVELNALKEYLNTGVRQVPFATAFDRAQLITVARGLNPLWPLTEILDGTRTEMAKCMETIDAFSAKCIRDRRAEMAAGDTERDDLLSRFMLLKDDETGELYTDK